MKYTPSVGAISRSPLPTYLIDLQAAIDKRPQTLMPGAIQTKPAYVGFYAISLRRGWVQPWRRETLLQDLALALACTEVRLCQMS